MSARVPPKGDRDPWNHAPGIPSEWRVLRVLTQLIVGGAAVLGPGWLVLTIDRSTSSSTVSGVGFVGVPLCLAMVGLATRRYYSATLGALLLVGAAQPPAFLLIVAGFVLVTR